jgi:predicted ATPase/DNA-binding winged helix-turn-helix (wHTH) protein
LQALHRFSGFDVQVAQRRLLVGGQAAVIGARAFDVLCALVERPGQLVSKRELLDTVWPDLVVEENNLVVQIGTLRKLLGADAIATIPGRGYRLVAQPLGIERDARVGGVDALPSGANLASHPHPLVGRAGDLADVCALLATHRLLTVTGAGGVGKTRVAEHVLQARRADFEHGVAWVELASQSDPLLLPGTIAGALGLPIGGGEPLTGLAAALSSLNVLICLDNAEHLIDEVAHVAQALLDAAPRLRLLVTSQAPLKLAGECVYHLEPLGLPDPQASLQEAARCGAVELFIQRAAAADRRFQFDAQTLPSVLSICSQLDGVALALELAAARVPMLGVTTLAQSLDERLHMLNQGRRDAPERQRTLRAALEWSHALLNSTEAVVFYRLGVFVGGFSLEAARQVAADGSIDSWQVVDALGALVDRSLVAVDGGESPRYRLLESARALATERLAASGEESIVRQRHADATTQHFLAITAASRDGHCGVDEAVERLDPDLDNGRTALAWFLAHGDATGAVSLAPSMSAALTMSRHAERSRLFDVTTPLVSDALPPAVRATWAAACSGHWYWRKPLLAIEWAQLAVNLYRELRDEGGLYRSLSMLGMAASRADDRATCEATCAELNRFDAKRFSARLQFMASTAQFLWADRTGDVARMMKLLGEQLKLAKAAGDSANVHNVLSNLADTELTAGLVDDAVAHGKELESRLRGTRHQTALAYAQVGLTGALLAQGDLVSARDMAHQAWPLAVRFDIKHPLADILALLAATEGRMADACRLRGYADAGYITYGLVRQTAELRAAERADELARASIGDAAFEQLRIEGTALSDGDAYRIALEGLASS